MPLSAGDKAPAFSLPASAGRTADSTALKGRPYVLYFYPKASTSGCTTQACAFQEALPRFDKLKIPVIGVSPDPMKAIEKFAAAQTLHFPLASDTDHRVAEAYGVWVEKSMYGRKYMGIERTTLLIGADGVILRIWPKVKIPGHVADVLAAVETLPA